MFKIELVIKTFKQRATGLSIQSYEIPIRVTITDDRITVTKK